jgi:hypothetical protein
MKMKKKSIETRLEVNVIIRTALDELVGNQEKLLRTTIKLDKLDEY